MSIENIEKKLCMGCALCGDICPTNAISYTRNSEGFIYPIIDRDKCFSCGLCEKQCPVRNANGKPLGQCIEQMSDLKAYAITCNDMETRRMSSSGGVFPLLANLFIENGGVVYGVAYDEKWSVKHVRIQEKADIARLQSSKYVQSDTAGIYRDVKEDLKKGMPVMFTGTPCQSSALKNYLGQAYTNLFCVDLFCHGVSSPGLFEQYLKEEIKVDVSDIKSISFRDKAVSWEKYRMKIVYNQGEYARHYRKDAFLKPFCRSVSLRESCYECTAKGFPRCSDLTIGDFWVIDRVFPDMNDHKGASVVFCNNAVGKQWIDQIKDKAKIREIDFETIKDMYFNSGKPVAKPQNRDQYFKTVKTQGLRAAMKLYCKISYKERVIRSVRNLLIRLHVYECIRKWKRGV